MGCITQIDAEFLSALVSHYNTRRSIAGAPLGPREVYEGLVNILQARNPLR